MMKAAPNILQSLPPPNTFSVPSQAPPPSLLQAQLSAVSLAPLLQNPPQPLLPQPPPKGNFPWNYIDIAREMCKAVRLVVPLTTIFTVSHSENEAVGQVIKQAGIFQCVPGF